MASCTAQHGPAPLTPHEFAKATELKNAQLIDVRTAAEFGQGHLKGARNLDWTNGDLQHAMSGLDKTAPVLVYCASGRRSADASAALRQAGFKDVQDLQGGIRAWAGQGLPITP